MSKVYNYTLLIVLLALVFLMLNNLIPRYQFFSVRIGGGYIQLRGDILTGELEQVFIK